MKMIYREKMRQRNIQTVQCVNTTIHNGVRFSAVLLCIEFGGISPRKGANERIIGVADPVAAYPVKTRSPW